MGKLIDQLRAAGVLNFQTNYKSGSVLDLSPAPLAAPTVVATPEWGDTPRGNGLVCPRGTFSVLDYGLAAKCDLGATGTVWVALDVRSAPSGAEFDALISKILYAAGNNGYQIIWDSANLYFKIISVAVLNQVTPAIAGNVSAGLHLFAMTWTGTNLIAYINGMQKGIVAQTTNPTPAGQNLFVGNGGTAGGARIYPSRNPILSTGISSAAITGAQHAQLYDELLQESWVKSLARTNFRYTYPAKRASEYAAEGIFFDTPEKRRADGLVADYTGNYPGTFVGTPVPAKDDLYEGSGIMYNGAADWCNHQNMSQVNGNTTFTVDGWVEWPTGNIAASSWWVYNNAGGGNFFTLGQGGGASTSAGLYMILGTGAATTVELALRAGTRQHLAMTFNNGVAKFYVDGEVKTTNVTLPLPAAFPNFSATPMRIGTVCKFTPHSTRMRTTLLTDAQIRAEYLKTGAKHLTLRETLEDVPVTLAASVASPGQIGPWQVVADTWACVERSNGRRSLRHVGVSHGALSRPSTDAFGTWHFFMRVGTVVVQEHYVLFMTSLPGAYNAAGGQNGYMIYFNASQAYLFRMTAGASTSIGVSALGTIVVDTEYEVVVARRASDCRFTVWMRGGAWGTTWTQVIQAADTSHTTSKYISLGSVTSVARNDEFPMFDPDDERYALHHWQGQLDPTAGELLKW